LVLERTSNEEVQPVSILTASALAQSLLESTPGEAARELQRAAAEQMRQFTEQALQEVIRLSLEGALGPARKARGETPVAWPCRRCGPRLAHQLMRNGTYGRSPLTRYGPVSLRIPQLVCRGCGRSVAFVLPCLPRFRRLWCDVEHELVKAYLGGHSYRSVAGQIAGHLSLMTVWRTVQRAADGPHKPPATPKLKAVGVDEMHVRVKGEAAWYLVARGALEQGGGYYLGAVLSEDRSQAAWQQALEGLGVQGLAKEVPLIADGDAAIEAAVALCLPGRRLDRCAWHVLHNVSDSLREKLPGLENEGLRAGLMAGAQSVVNAATPDKRQKSLQVLSEVAPAWLTTSLSQALTRVGYPGAATPRTNNVCERGFREWRRRIRPMDGFGSKAGAKNFGILWMLKENARLLGLNWMEVIMP
jgi:transposase-like protein